MAVTRKEVAAMAGVSVATVSYVINNTKKVTPEVRERVLKAAEHLNYHPNLVAKGLVTKETKHVAVLTDNIQNPHYGRILRGVQHVAEQEGYIVSVLSTNYSPKQTITELLSRNMDGIILALGFYVNQDFAAGLNVPMSYEDENLYTDYRQAIFDIVKTLKELGHTRIAYLSGFSNTVGHVRYFHLMDALAYYGLTPYEELIIPGDGYSDEAAGYNAADRLLETTRDFTAVLALNDMMAIGAMRRFWEEGLRIPDDISLVGCDGIKTTAFTTPPLSTIQCHAFHLGEALMSRLIAKIHQEEDDPPLPVKTIEAEFVQRESVGKAPR